MFAVWCTKLKNQFTNLRSRAILCIEKRHKPSEGRMLHTSKNALQKLILYYYQFSDSDVAVC
jgi:hypothetical protein